MKVGFQIGAAACATIALVMAGPHSQAWATKISGITLPDAVVSGNVSATTTGDIEDPTNDTGTEEFGSGNLALTRPGWPLFEAAAPISCQCGVDKEGWIYSTSTVTGSVDISFLSNPSIHATASVLVPAAFGAESAVQVSAEIDYYFEIVDSSDPQEHFAVPIKVSATGGFAYSSDTPGFEYGGGYVESSFSVSGVLTDQIIGDATSGALASGPTSWSDDSTYPMQTNELYKVSLVAGFNGSLNGGDGGGGRAMSAYVDPTFAFADESDAGRYDLVFSDGVGNSPAGTVPEPSTWAMMLIGFAGLGFTARRRIAAASAA